MRKVIIGPIKDLFTRGRELARLADRRGPIPERSLLSFGDPSDVPPEVQAQESAATPEPGSSDS